MEEPTRLTRARRRAAAVLAVLVFALGTAGQAEEGDLPRAVKALGAPGTLWGRLAVEEESPDGPWTPLAGVGITVYPYAAELAADLERIRDGARASGRDYDAAIARLQERLNAHANQVHAITGTTPLPAPTPSPAPAATPPPAPAAPGMPPTGSGILTGLAGRLGFGEKTGTDPARPDAAATGSGGAAAPSAAEGLIRRATTDATGVFLFKFLPAGDWLVVAIQTSQYSAPRRPPSSSTRAAPGKNRDGFLQSERPAAKEAEVWVVRMRVTSDESSRLLLTDRSRFMVGPVR